MDVFCAREDWACTVDVLCVGVHALQAYCSAGAILYLLCFRPLRSRSSEAATRVGWWGCEARGLASLALGATWCASAAAAALRPQARAALAAPLAALPAWLAATALQAVLESRRSSAALLAVSVYWSVCACAVLVRLLLLLSAGAAFHHAQVLFNFAAALLATSLVVIDSVVMFLEVSKKYVTRTETKPEEPRIIYKHNSANFYSKITFFWLRSLLLLGYSRLLEMNDLGELPPEEKSSTHYYRFKSIYQHRMRTKQKRTKRPSLWRCYFRSIWPNFYLGGALKLFGDALGLVPPLGISVVVQYAVELSATESASVPAAGTHVTLDEFVRNGFVMALIILLSSIGQGILSQNSTHLVYVEGIRLKTALQCLLFDKCLDLASWSGSPAGETQQESLVWGAAEEGEEEPGHGGLVNNLITQDTYNIMSFVWIAHYIWAIPLKIIVILYLLYTKLGVSAVIGSTAAVFLITPLQFYIGKRMSTNSKEISKRSDHRIAKLSEILHGMKTIKLCVWEDIFKEKILNLREMELQLLNKESFYWGALTFTTHVSTIAMTVVTLSVCLALGERESVTAVNVFAGLALINQLTVPLFILPITVSMIVQAAVSTTRIEDFMTLPESCNRLRGGDGDSNKCHENQRQRRNKLNMAFTGEPPDDDNSYTELDRISETEAEDESLQSGGGEFDSDEEAGAGTGQRAGVLVRMRGAVFAWGEDENVPTLQIDNLDIPNGKLIMVVGATGSGKSSLLSALLGEMHLERGDILWNGCCSTAYAGQTPWMVNAHVRENIVLGGAWCARRYSRVLRAVALLPDLRLLPEGDLTRLGALGVSLSGGQRARVCVARALYSRARLLALDEPLAALDPGLARHLLARALVPASRQGRTILVATNRIDFLHYADIVVMMEEGRVRGCGSPADVMTREPLLAAGVRAAARTPAASSGCHGDSDAAGGGGAAARERRLLSRALNRASLKCPADDEPSRLLRGRGGVHGSYYLAELPAEEWCGSDGQASWSRGSQLSRARPRLLLRQLSSPPAPAAQPAHLIFRQQRGARAVRRAASAGTTSATLRREVSVLRRLLRPPTLRWTPRPLRRLFSNESSANADLTDNEHQDRRPEEGTEDATEKEVGVDEDQLGSEPTEEPTDHGIAGAGAHDEPLENLPSYLANGVHGRVYWKYVRACGAWAPAYCAAALACQALAVAADCWLARWTAEQSQTHQPAEMGSWLRGYCVLCGAGALAAAGAQACAQAGGAAARRTLHETLLHVVLHLPLRFFDHTPFGRTLNRFSADLLVLDKKLCSATQRWSQFALLCVSAVLVNAAVSPWCLLAAAPLAALYCALQELYSRNARSLQRLEATTAAPLVSLLGEARAGAAVVRAGGLQPRLRRQLLQRLDANHSAFLLLNTTNRWLGTALDVLGACVVFLSLTTALMAACVAPTSVPPALVGLVASYTMLLPAYLAWVVKFRGELDMCMGAVERILHYTELPEEDYRENVAGAAALPAGWPARGEIVLEGVSVRHAPDAAPVLHDLTLTIPPGQKVAVCGRSGGGKSSLVLACAGAAEVCAGALRVDGVDVSRVPLRALRRALCVLPQDAALFSGTLRENLDPLAAHTDDELWDSLRAAKLDQFVAAQPAALECPVRGEGAGWSAGRRARACCARAVLCASRAGAAALLLDEPGAALDARSDTALRAELAAQAPTRTLITVAHRVSAVCEYDRVLVVEEGRLAEQGSPAALLADPGSLLARMLAASRSHPPEPPPPPPPPR